jgi:hypothetical protein
VADEEAVPGELGDHAHVEAEGGIGAGVEVLHEELAARMCARMSACSRSKASGAMGALFSHQMPASTEGSRTTNLSLGERPVCWPVSTSSVPPRPISPSPRRTAASTRAGSIRL